MKKLILVACAVMGAVAAQAQILLNVDITNPNAATITATDGLAAISSSGLNYRIQLNGFFATTFTPVTAHIDTTGDLRPTIPGLDYDRISPINSATYLRVFHGFAGSTQNFVAGQRAFSGVETADVTSISPFLRTSNFVGNIEIVNNFGVPTGQILGQYSLTAVPEPATMAALGFGALTLIRRRKK